MIDKQMSNTHAEKKKQLLVLIELVTNIIHTDLTGSLKKKKKNWVENGT